MLEQVRATWNASTGEYVVSFDIGREHLYLDLKQHSELFDLADVLDRFSLKVRKLAAIQEWERRAKVDMDSQSRIEATNP